MRRIMIRMIHAVVRIASRILMTDLPFDVWLDSSLFERNKEQARFEGDASEPWASSC